MGCLKLMAFVVIQIVLFAVLMPLMSTIVGGGIIALGLAVMGDSPGGSVVSFMALFGGMIIGFILTLMIQVFLTVKYVYPRFYGNQNPKKQTLRKRRPKRHPDDIGGTTG